MKKQHLCVEECFEVLEVKELVLKSHAGIGVARLSLINSHLSILVRFSGKLNIFAIILFIYFPPTPIFSFSRGRWIESIAQIRQA